MKKKRLIIASAVLLVFGLAAFSFAKTDGSQGASSNSGKNTENLSQGTGSAAANTNANQNQEKNQEKNQNKNQGTATAGENAQENQEQEKNKEKNSSSAAGQVDADSHRSAVAKFVQNLLEVAKNEGSTGENGIGAQVRNVAMQQNQGETQTITAMEQIQARSKIKTFLIGSDYKNLGALRSEMVQTRNRIRQLTELMNKAEGDETKQQLQEQIQLFEQEQAKIEQFITENENKISLFGWLAKMFQ